MQLALKLDGSKVEGRAIRVRRSAKKEARRAPPRTPAATRRRRPDDAYKGEMARPDQKAKKKTGKKAARKNARRT